MHVHHFVIEDGGSGDGLIEIPVQILPRDFFDGLHEIFAGGMCEAIAHEIGVQRLAKVSSPMIFSSVRSTVAVFP